MTISELYHIYQQYPAVQTDTRKLKKGDLFFALKGPHFNGNRFAKAAIDSGAAYAIIDEADWAITGKTIVVEDVLTTLQELAAYHRRQLSIPVIGITGSNGKTTTKELIYAVLSTTYTTYTTEGNLNNHIGVPLTLLKVKPDAQMAIIEMGANHIGEIAAYCLIAAPTHGLITNCGKAHLEGFGSEEGIKIGKGELYQSLAAHNGTAFVMWDYTYLQEMSKPIAHRFTYGTAHADVTGIIMQSDPFLSVQFTHGFNGTVATHLVGGYNLPNVLAAVAAGVFFKVPDEKIKYAIETYIPSNSRSQLVQKGTNTIILDAYNANPSSMKLAVDNLATMAGDHKILVLGAMAELGADSLQEHQLLLAEIDKHTWQQVLLVGGDFLKVPTRYVTFGTAAEAGEWLQQHPPQEAQLLIKGSRSMQMEKVLDYL